MNIQIEISISVVLGEWDKSHDPDCDEDFCANPKEKIAIEKYVFPSLYDSLKRHDILLIKLARPITITRKYVTLEKS